MHYKQLGVFARTPVPGKVKTRLSPPLSPDQSCGLYRVFLIDLFARLQKLKKINVTIFHADEQPGELRTLAPVRSQLIAQEGAHLGERMNNALQAQLDRKNNAVAVLIGSDSPDIPIQYINRAFMKLKHHDVVIGPASDGGYYLIGLRAPQPRLFESIDWGGATVLEQTLDIVQSEKLSMSVLPLWYDVDDISSLQTLKNLMTAKRLAGDDRLPATAAYLADNNF